MSRDDDPGLARAALRTVTPGYSGRRDVEMDVVGWGYFLALLVLLVPLLPFIVIVWTVSKILEWVDRRRGREQGPGSSEAE